MKERKVINKVFSKSNCIISDELMRIYDDRINDTIRKEYENGWNIISCTPLICQDGSEIIYTMIFENDIIDNSNTNSCEDERKYNNDVMKEIEKEYENGKGIFYKRTLIDTHRIAVDDAFNYSTDELAKKCLDVRSFCGYIDNIVKINKRTEYTK